MVEKDGWMVVDCEDTVAIFGGTPRGRGWHCWLPDMSGTSTDMANMKCNDDQHLAQSALVLMAVEGCQKSLRGLLLQPPPLVSFV
mmetsp:Transcript_20341/g.56159  ORF Transcript_20341/g.56159 Transcript_20341/m.56159 type:complete len:85 (-) Transcript_20341:58-312(-)